MVRVSCGSVSQLRLYVLVLSLFTHRPCKARFAVCLYGRGANDVSNISRRVAEAHGVARNTSAPPPPCKLRKECFACR